MAGTEAEEIKRPRKGTCNAMQVTSGQGILEGMPEVKQERAQGGCLGTESR